MTYVQKIMLANSKQEVRTILEEVELIEMRYNIVLNAIKSLDTEVESDISMNNVDTALLKMSRVVMLEDESNIIERLLLKQGLVKL